MYKSSNPGNRYIAQTEEIKENMIQRGKVSVGDRIYVVESKKEYILGFDNEPNDYVNPTGGGSSVTLQDKQVSYTSNGVNTVTADSGYDGLSSVEVDVSVQPNLQSKSVSYTTNGQKTVTPTSGYDGMSDVSVSINVQPRLQEQSVDYTENGSYTVVPDTGYDGLSRVGLNISISGGGDVLIEKTYAELVSLRDGGQLEPGAFYRITDFVTTVNGTYHRDGDNEYVHYARSAEHPFDVIVLAINGNTLSEDAAAIQHSGDTYFANNNLSAWEIKYTIENDASRFLWADETSGKGVIYYMKDEFNNEAWYDFKNVQFLMYPFSSDTDVNYNSSSSYNTCYAAASFIFADLYGHGINTDYWDKYINLLNDSYELTSFETPSEEFLEYSKAKYIYTFNYTENGEQKDASLNNNEHNKCFGNTIGRTKGLRSTFDALGYNNDNSYSLNMCTFNESYETFNNKIEENCFGIAFGKQSSSNIVKNMTSNCVILNNCNNNKIGSYCQYIFICNSPNNDKYSPVNDNIVGDYCIDILLDSPIGSIDSNNVIGNNCQGFIGKDGVSNTIKNKTVFTLGDGCSYNTIGNDCEVRMSENCTNNTIGNNSSIYLNSGCCDNLFYSWIYVDMGPECSSNIFMGYNDGGLTLGSGCFGNIFGFAVDRVTLGDNCWENNFNNNVSSFTLPDDSWSCTILPGDYSGTEIQEDLSINAKFIGLDSNGNVKIWNPADLVQ